MGVAREISQDFLRAAEWAFAIDHPLCVAQGLQIRSECLRIDKPRMLAEELQFTGPIGGAELVQEQPAEQFREHAHRQKEARPARDPTICIEREPAARHDHVHMRVVGHCRAPGVQDGQDSDASAEMLGIGCDGEHGLG